jgi:hypothetical protein
MSPITKEGERFKVKRCPREIPLHAQLQQQAQNIQQHSTSRHLNPSDVVLCELAARASRLARIV